MLVELVQGSQDDCDMARGVHGQECLLVAMIGCKVVGTLIWQK